MKSLITVLKFSRKSYSVFPFANSTHFNTLSNKIDIASVYLPDPLAFLDIEPPKILGRRKTFFFKLTAMSYCCHKLLVPPGIHNLQPGT